MNKNIFIIDKEAVVLYSLRSMLSEIGCRVGTKNCPCTADNVIEEIADSQSRVLIVDIDSIEKGAWKEFFHALRAHEILKNICIVVYSANDEVGIKESLIKNGANFTFSKNDLSIAEFFEKITKIYKNIIKK